MPSFTPEFPLSLKEGSEPFAEVKYQSDGARQTTFLTINNNCYLGDVLNTLPCGIINKSSTGIGGTTLELDAQRNSIIVEPLRSIASSKAEISNNFLYVGSAIKNFKTTSPEDIKAYIENNEIKPKKILVVADSLPKVIEAIGLDNLDQYFITIDEVDSFQGDSQYRNSMEICLDYYKLFPIKNRCLISATMMTFHDKHLSGEPITIIKQQEFVGREIILRHSDTINHTLIARIKEIQETGPEDKIAVAYNSLSEVIDVIDNLVDDNKISEDDIAILCSMSNKKKAGKYYQEIESYELPKKLNFLTSAYYTGIDIKENFHCISISDATKKNCILSDKKLKQIAGRCRCTLLSETVIYRCLKSTDDQTEKTAKELEVAAYGFIDAIRCFERINNGKLQFTALQENLVACSDYYGYKVVRKDYKGKPNISYFNIDSIIENDFTRRSLLSSPEQMLQRLDSEGHKIVTFEDISIYPASKTRLSNKQLQLDKEEVLDNLKSMDKWTAQNIYDLKYECKHAFQERMYSKCLQLFDYLAKEDIIKAVDRYSDISGRNEWSYKYFWLSVKFESLPDEDYFKRAVYAEFEIGRVVSAEEVIEILTTIIQIHFPLHKKHISSAHEAMWILNSYVHTRRYRPTGETRRLHKIIGKNPRRVQLKKKAFIDFDAVITPRPY